MGFLSTLFTGNNPTLSNQVPVLGQIAGNSSKLGTNDVSDASDFFHSILSGGGGKYLAPQTDQIQKQGNNQLLTLDQFSNRGGGTNAQAQTVGDRTRANINDLYAGQATGAAQSLANIGSNQQQLGLTAYGQQAQLAQQIQQNQQNSIFGKGISSAVSAAESFGLGTGFNALSPSTFSTMYGAKPGTSSSSSTPTGFNSFMSKWFSS